MNIFFLFEEEYEKQPVDSIWEIKLPIERIKEYLEKRFSVTYHSNLWVYTQLRRYEEDLGVKLFERIPAKQKGSFYLSIYKDMVKFYQKQHLYVSKKIKVANGVYDKIRNDFLALPDEEKKTKKIKILLGAGSTIFHLANIIAQKSWEDNIKYSIYTHNLGSLKRLLEPTVNYDRIKVSTPSGTVDPVTYTIIGDSTNLYHNTSFDYIIMGTSYIYKGKLYVESKAETEIKNTILNYQSKAKILILTKHEFTDIPPSNPKPFGNLSDYTYIVVPRFNITTKTKKKHDLIFNEYNKTLVPEIIHWNYSILKCSR